MSNLSDFVGAAGGEFYIGLNDQSGLIKVFDGDGVAFVSDAEGELTYSLDGSTLAGSVGKGGYIEFTSGLWVDVRSFSRPSTNPSGLTFDGTNLISCNYSPGTIYVHDGISTTILNSFASPSSSPHGLAFDGTNLISCDSSSDTIYIHGSPVPEYAAIQFLVQEV